MGSPTVLHFQCSVGNTILLLIPCTELRISANASPYGFLVFVVNSTLNILSARGLAHSERQRNVKNVTLRNTELHNTKKAIYFTTFKITFIKHPKEKFFCPVATWSFCARSPRKTGCSLHGLRLRSVRAMGIASAAMMGILAKSKKIKLWAKIEVKVQGPRIERRRLAGCT